MFGIVLIVAAAVVTVKERYSTYVHIYSLHFLFAVYLFILHPAGWDNAVRYLWLKETTEGFSPYTFCSILKTDWNWFFCKLPDGIVSVPWTKGLHHLSSLGFLYTSFVTISPIFSVWNWLIQMWKIKILHLGAGRGVLCGWRVSSQYHCEHVLTGLFSHFMWSITI